MPDKQYPFPACCPSPYLEPILPLDLALEHFNRLIKILIRNLGPNGLNKRAINRYCDALGVNKSILDNFDTLCGVSRRSGKHYCRSVAAELEKIVKELINENALVLQEKRDLSHFQGFQDSLLSNSDLRSLFKWITTHKKNVHLKSVHGKCHILHILYTL